MAHSPHTAPQPVPTDAPNQVIFEAQHGQAALYVDGRRALVGPADEVLRRSLEIAGVKVSFSEDFLRGADVGPEGYPDATAPTLAAVEEYAAVKVQVEALRTKAEALSAEADELEQRLFTATPDQPVDVLTEPYVDETFDQPVVDFDGFTVAPTLDES